MPRKLKCECGECNTCKMREYMRMRTMKRKLDEARVKNIGETAEFHMIPKEEPQETQPREKKQDIVEGHEVSWPTIKEEKPMVKPDKRFKGIAFLEVVDNTGVGLEIDISRARGTLTVVLSLPEKEIDIIKTTLKSIRPRETQTTMSE